jgi:hypothetical protein
MSRWSFTSLGVGAAIALTSTLAGCPSNPTTSGSPTPTPTASPTPTTPTPTPTAAPTSTAQVFKSGTAIVNGTLTVAVKKPDGTPLDGATVTLAGPTAGWGTTAGGTSLAFNPIEGGTYSILVSAPGYVTQAVNTVTVDPKATNTQTVTMSAQAGRALGRVLDGNGNPVAGVRVTSGNCGTTTDSTGHYTLSGLPSGASTVAIARTSFVPTTTSVTLSGSDATLADVRLTSASASPSFEFENVGQSYGGTTVGTAFQPLISALQAAGFTYQATPSTASIRIVASPTSASVSDAQVEALRQFVWNGGKLILIGEWGGSFDYTPEALNRLARPYGLAFNPDLVRSPGNAVHPEWLSIPSFNPVFPQPTPVANGIELFAGCSLFVPPPAVGFAFAGSDGYRIQTDFTTGPCLAAVRVYGQGMVIGLGDSSAWTAGNITGKGLGNGNLGEADNQKFMLDLFSW